MSSINEKRDKMFQKLNCFVKKIIDWKIVISIQSIASVLLIALILKLNALPSMYIVSIVTVIVLLWLLSIFLTKPSRKVGKGKARNIVGKIVSLLLSIFLLICSLYIAKGHSVLDKITDANKQTARISMIVMKKSSYEKISDLKNQVVEVNLSVDEENMDKAIEALNKEESSIQVNDVKDFEVMVDDLYSNKTAAIYVNEAYYAILKEHHEDLEDETRIIYSYDVVTEVNNISKNVDVTKSSFTIYISGIDTTGPVSTISRSDVNMLVTVNSKTKQILMTSIPRDYYITLANKGQKDKLTHAGLAGVENSVKSLENFLGIDINYYAKVNFTSLIKIVDALGGITVNSPVAFTTRKGGYYIQVGDNQMDGEKALGFVRERYSLANGDNDRIKNQQRVLTAMLQKAMSPAIITNYTDILNSISGSFETNMTSNEITSLIKMQLNDMASWDIKQIQLDGTGQSMTGGAYMPNNRLYYMIPDDESVATCTGLIKDILSGKKIEID